MKIHATNLSYNDDFIRFLEKTNPSQSPVTIERLRSYPGCEHYNDQNANEIMELLHQMALIILELHDQENSICIDNQHFVNLESEKHSSVIPISFSQNKAA